VEPEIENLEKQEKIEPVSALDYAAPSRKRSIKPLVAAIVSIAMGILQWLWIGGVGLFAWLFISGDIAPTPTQSRLIIFLVVLPLPIAGFLGLFAAIRSRSSPVRIIGLLGLVIAICWSVAIFSQIVR
jgi:hypothetical protein